jgi:hypothetical protein
VQDEEAVAIGARPVAAVQLRDGLVSHGEQTLVVFEDLLIRIDSVRQKRVGQIAAGAREVMDFEPLDLFEQINLAGEQGRHDNECPKRWRNTFRQFKTRQRCCAGHHGDDAVDEGVSYFRRRQKCHQSEQHEPAEPDAGDRQRPQCECQQDRGDDEGGGDIAADPQVADEATDPEPERWLKPDGLLQRAPAVADQVVAGISSARPIRCRSIGCM